MAGFFKMFKRLNSNVLGVVTGADFKNGSFPFAYLGKGEKPNQDKLMIYGEKLDDFIFCKEDIASAKVLQQEVTFKGVGNHMYKGPKYEIRFNNGKIAIVSIPAAEAYRIENLIY